MYNEIEGDLIKLAQQGRFDVIAHGCNCFCRMKRGIAPQIAQAFGCDKFPLEDEKYVGDINKLGQIDYDAYPVLGLIVVNAYTQYQWGTELKPFDYDAFTLCMRKMNRVFTGKHIGLPQIGSHLAGGDWELIRPIIQRELADCNVTVVIYKPEEN
jgi:O-acetyl-ADP-ribose deacetylase (regulator of RNase III)